MPWSGSPPHLLQMPEDRLRERPGRGGGAQAPLARLEQRVDHLALHVELHLPGGGVPHPDGARAGVAGQPGKFDLGEQAFARDAVHDLHLVRAAGDRADQPVAPRSGLLQEAGAGERGEQQGAVAQPAEAVVPVARTAQHFRQGGGRRGDDAARGPVGERLQGQERAPDGGHPWSVVGASGHPVRPERLRLGELPAGVGGLRRRQVRGGVGEDENRFLALAHLEVGDGAEVLAARRHGGAQHHLVRAGDAAEVGTRAARHPGHGEAVVEAQHQLHAHRHASAQAADDADQVGAAVARRHEVDEGDGAVAVGRLHRRFQNQGVAAVLAPGPLRREVARRDAPAAVLRRPEQGGEAGRAVEARPAEPVHRAVARDERRRFAIADERVVLDRRRPPFLIRHRPRRLGGGPFFARGAARRGLSRLGRPGGGQASIARHALRPAAARPGRGPPRPGPPSAARGRGSWPDRNGAPRRRARPAPPPPPAPPRALRKGCGPR